MRKNHCWVYGAEWQNNTVVWFDFSALDATAIQTKLHCSFVSAWKEPNKFKVPLGALCLLYLSEKMDIEKIWKLIIHGAPSN